MATGTQPHPCALSHTHTDQNLWFHDPMELNYNSVSVEQRGCEDVWWGYGLKKRKKKVMGARAADVKSCYLCENDSIRTGIFLLRARELHTPTTETGGNPPIPHFFLLLPSILPLSLWEDIIPAPPLVSAALIAHLSSLLPLPLSGGLPFAR